MDKTPMQIIVEAFCTKPPHHSNKPFTPQSPFTPVNNFVRGILGQNTEKDNQGSKKSWLI